MKTKGFKDLIVVTLGLFNLVPSALLTFEGKYNLEFNFF
jgi:hypothetical protein